MSKSQQKRLDAQHDDAWYIRQGVELAKNFWGTSVQAYGPSGFHRPYASFEVDSPDTRMFLDALVAQLTRQADAITGIMLFCYTDEAAIYTNNNIIVHNGHGRAMNTLKVIIDSGVLEDE